MRVSAIGLGRIFMLSGAWGVFGFCLQAIKPLFLDGGSYNTHAFPLVLMVIIGVFYLLSLAMSLANLYLGANMSRLLLEKPHLPMRFTRLTMVLSLLSFNVVGFLINLYIWKELRRLASEAEPAVESHILE